MAAKAWTMFEYGRADPARSAHFQNLAARLTHTKVRSRGKCRVLPWLHSLSGNTAPPFFDQGRPRRISPTMIEWLGRCFPRGRADPARSAHFKNLAASLTHTEVRSRGECSVLPWVHSLSGDTALPFLIRADRAGSALPWFISFSAGYRPSVRSGPGLLAR